MIAAHRTSDNRGNGKPHFVHPNGIKIGVKLFAVKFYVQKPIVFKVIRIGKRIIYEKIADGIINGQQLLYFKVIFACKNNQLCVGQSNFVEFIFKLSVLIYPKDDSAFIKFRQWRGEPSIQVSQNFLCIHTSS